MQTTEIRDPFPELGTPYPVPQRYRPAPPVRRTPVARRLFGVLVLLVLTAASVPVHVLAVFFVYVQLESPGDGSTAFLTVGGGALASFLALLLTATIAQLAGGFPGRWRARTTFAVLSAVLSISVAYALAFTYL